MLHVPQKWAIIALFLLTLVVGILIGLFIPRPGITPFEERTFTGPPGPARGGPDLRGVENFLEETNFSNEQKQKIADITETYRDSMYNLIHQNRRETMQKVLSLRKNLHNDMADILTEEQFERWQQIYDRNVRKLGPPAHMGPRGGRPQNWDNRRGPQGNMKGGRRNQQTSPNPGNGQKQSPSSNQDQ